MADHLTYWRPKTVEDELGRPISHAGSEQFGGVEVGDTLWFVSMLDQRLHLIGSLSVSRVMSQTEAVLEFGHENVWKARYHVVAMPGTEVVARAHDISGIASELRFEGGVDRLPAGFSGQSLQAMRRLTPESAILLQNALRQGN